MTTRTPTPTTKQQSLLDSLSNPASALGNDTKPVKKEVRPERGSFFFRLGVQPDELLRRKQLTEPKVIPQTGREINVRAKAYEKELPEALATNVDQVREFLLTVLGPLTLAADTGLTQAMEVLAQATDSEVDPGIRRKFEQMLHKGASLKLSKFIATYLGLSRKDAELLMESIAPAKPQTLLFPPLDQIKPEPLYRGDNENQSRKQKAKNKVKEADSPVVLPRSTRSLGRRGGEYRDLDR